MCPNCSTYGHKAYKCPWKNDPYDYSNGVDLQPAYKKFVETEKIVIGRRRKQLADFGGDALAEEELVDNMTMNHREYFMKWPRSGYR